MEAKFNENGSSRRSPEVAAPCLPAATHTGHHHSWLALALDDHSATMIPTGYPYVPEMYSGFNLGAGFPCDNPVMTNITPMHHSHPLEA